MPAARRRRLPRARRRAPRARDLRQRLLRVGAPVRLAAALLALGATLRTTAASCRRASCTALPTEDDRRRRRSSRRADPRARASRRPSVDVYLKAMDRKRWAFPHRRRRRGASRRRDADRARRRRADPVAARLAVARRARRRDAAAGHGVQGRSRRRSSQRALAALSDRRRGRARGGRLVALRDLAAEAGRLPAARARGARRIARRGRRRHRRASASKSTRGSVHCSDWELGPGASLRCGLAALSDEVEAALVVLADGPDSTRAPSSACWAPGEGGGAVAASYGGVRLHPVPLPGPTGTLSPTTAPAR